MKRKDLANNGSSLSKRLSRAEALSYIRRHRLIERIEEGELQELSVVERLRRIAWAMGLGLSLGFTSGSEGDIDPARKRWEELRRAAR